MAMIAAFELPDARSNSRQSAELWDTIEPRHREHLEIQWAQALTELLAQMPAEHREESAHWNWPDKLDRSDGIIGRQAYIIECGGMTQAVMLVDLNKTSRFPATRGESIVYVDYLQTAPWNWKRDCQPHPQFRGLGTMMLQVAIQLSLELDFDGRVGLHSLPQSEDFYRARGMKDFWRDPDYDCLVYFETTAIQANSLLNRGDL